MINFSKELLLLKQRIIEESPEENFEVEYTVVGEYSVELRYRGRYQIEMVGGGGGGCVNASDGNYGVPSSGGAGASGAYFKGIFRFNEPTVLSGYIGGGGGGVVTNFYGYPTANSGGESKMCINDTLVLVCNGGSGAYGNGIYEGGSVDLRVSTYLVETIESLKGNDSTYTLGGYYTVDTLGNTVSHYGNTGDSPGAGGGCGMWYGSNGLNGALKITFMGN